jgi:hypothetical protein
MNGVSFYFISIIIQISCIQRFKIRFPFGNGVEFSVKTITIVSLVVNFEIEFVVFSIIYCAIFLGGKVVRSHRQAENGLYMLVDKKPHWISGPLEYKT